MKYRWLPMNTMFVKGDETCEWKFLCKSCTMDLNGSRNKCLYSFKFLLLLMSVKKISWQNISIRNC